MRPAPAEVLELHDHRQELVDEIVEMIGHALELLDQDKSALAAGALITAQRLAEHLYHEEDDER
jgi:hypothetical protein